MSAQVVVGGAIVSFTDGEVAACTALSRSAVTAVQRLVAMYPRGQTSSLSELKTFQAAWNSNYSTLVSVLKKMGNPNVSISVPLTVDGLWGPNTSAAVWFSMWAWLPSAVTLIPPHSVDVTAWYASFKSQVDSLPQVVVAFFSSAPTPVQSSPSPAPTAADTQAVLAPAQSPPAPTYTSSPPTPSATVSSSAPMVPSAAASDIAVAAAASNAPLVAAQAANVAPPPVVQSADFSASPTPIVARPMGSRIPWLAVGVFGAVLGGSMLYFTKGKGRRR